MLQECQFDYGNGRHCRRVPARGEVFCRDHRRWSAPLRRALPVPAHVSGSRARTRSLPPLGGLGLDELLLDVASSLQALEPLVRGSASSAEVLRYRRACTAIGYAMDRLAGQPEHLRSALPSWSPERLRLFIRVMMYAAAVPSPGRC